MCGICGFFNLTKPSGLDQLLLMNKALQHRGPDDEGMWFSPDKYTGLGHRRLSIIDLSETGKQPMISKTGRFVTAFNGEIYNFRELRHELEGLGHTFKGTSDTEVMLASYEQWGILEALKKFNGMFAAAVWDRSEESLNLFRDRLGVKPLYYQWCGSVMYFSSELTKPFANLGAREIDREALALYCRHNYIPAPRTIYRNISKLMPGMLAKVTKSSATQGQWDSSQVYWDTRSEIDNILSAPNHILNMDQAVDLIETELKRSVAQHMISDVPLGAFLSGGIDSSLIVSHMQELSRTPIRTFTIGFRENFFNESNYAKQIAKHLGTDHTELIVTEKDALNVIPKIPLMYGEPFADSSQIPTFLVSELTRRNITVALSGDGGDELFAGYKSYTRLTQIQKYFSIFSPNVYVFGTKLLKSKLISQGISQTLGDPYYEWLLNALKLFARGSEKKIDFSAYSLFSFPERIVLGSQPGASLMPFYRCQGNIVEQKMTDDLIRYLPDDILAKVDRASMAVSLEVRAPFTDDYELFQTAWKIPFHLKADKTGSKLVLKKALAKHLPLEFFERPKMGFAVPLTKWLDGPLKDWVYSLINLQKIKREGYLDPNVLEELLVLGRKNEWYAYKLWAICIFESWFNSFHTVNN